MITNIRELTTLLARTIESVETDHTQVEAGACVANLAGKIIKSQALEIEYQRRSGSLVSLPFMEAPAE